MKLIRRLHHTHTNNNHKQIINDINMYRNFVINNKYNIEHDSIFFTAVVSSTIFIPISLTGFVYPAIFSSLYTLFYLPGFAFHTIRKNGLIEEQRKFSVAITYFNNLSDTEIKNIFFDDNLTDEKLESVLSLSKK